MAELTNEENTILVLEHPWELKGVLRALTRGEEEGPLYLMDMSEVVYALDYWKDLLPRVKPFYAVKCNPDQFLLATLAALGASFDCASQAELEIVVALGVPPERIIFASTAKLPSHIKFAARSGVYTSTFDSACELTKMKELCPQAKLVLRIRCDACDAVYQLGRKFGCDPVTEAPGLLQLAADLGLQVIGIAFHIGSGGHDFAAYGRAIQLSRALFAGGARAGHRMRLLDIGGGFPSVRDVTALEEVAAIINNALAKHFPDEDVEIIAEPGRYFASTPYILATMVHSIRQKKGDTANGDDSRTHTMYFIDDGVYGSFNCVLTNEPIHTVEILEPNAEKPAPSSVWGPTGDGLDCVLPAVMLPPLSVGDWLVFPDMGAYSICLTTSFNGFPKPRVKAVVDTKLWPVLSQLTPLKKFVFNISHAEDLKSISKLLNPLECRLCNKNSESYPNGEKNIGRKWNMNLLSHPSSFIKCRAHRRRTV